MADTSEMFREKLKAARKAERITQDGLVALSGIAQGTMRNIEQKGYATFDHLQMIFSVKQIERYAMWLMLDKTFPEIGQYSPEMIEAVRDEVNESLPRSERKKDLVVTDEMLEKHLEVIAEYRSSEPNQNGEAIQSDLQAAINQVLKKHAIV